MSIKKDNVSVTTVKYNDQDVNKVILDNKCVWCKAFTYTQGTLPTGVASLSCTRSSTDEPTASTGTISNGGTIYYDDKLYWTATASTGYRISAINGSSSPITVSGNITGTTSSSLAAARISGTISQGTLPANVASIKCYRKAYNGSSFSEYTGSTIYYGDQFYWTATASTGYNNPTLTYNSSSNAYTWTGSQGGSITSVGTSGVKAGSRKSFTITFGTTSGASLYGSWSASSQTAYYGDKITVSGTSIICYKWDATSTARWTVTVSPTANSAQYTYSTPTVVGSSISSVTAAASFTASNTRTLNSYTITWKYLSAYPDTWTTATETYNYGSTPSRTTASTVTSGSARKVSTGWDSLATVTGNRTITANYKTQFNVTFSGTRCSAKIDNVAAVNGWYDSGKTVTWTADTNCAFNSTGTTTTTTDTISNSKTTYTANAGYVNVTSLESVTCVPVMDDDFVYTSGWYAAGSKIKWLARDPYSFTPESNTDIVVSDVEPGINSKAATFIKRYTLTISATNGSYGTYSVSRTSSPYQGASTGALSNGATIYYGDVLTGSASPNTVSYGTWSVTSVAAPTYTTTGDAASGNLTIKNNANVSVTLYYNTAASVGGTSIGTAATNTTQTATGLKFDTQYYISARANRTRTKYTYSVSGTPYSGTNGVTGNVTASFSFARSSSTESGTLDSSVVIAKTAVQNTYTITWKYLKAYPDTWEQVTQTYGYGATPSRTSPSTVTSGNERKVFASWDSLATVTGNRTITATYTTQFAPTISASYCTADRASGSWYNSGTVITWTANDNYSFGGSAVKDTATTTITAGNVTYSKSPGYVKCSISGTRCSANKTSGSLLAVGSTITWTASSGYSYTEGTSATNPPNHTVVLGTTSYSRSCDYKSITVSSTNCSANVATGYRKLGNTITWTADSATNYKYSFSNANATSPVVTQTANIVDGTSSYSKTASYSYYKVTITTDANCTSTYGSGFLLKGTTITFSTTGATSTIRYSFSNSSSTNYNKTATVSSAGQTISSGIVYTWYNATITAGTNCTVNKSSDWYIYNTTITWTANPDYAFNSSGASTTTANITAAGTYTKTPGYGKFTVNAAYCTANVATGWYAITSSKSVTYTADANWSFGGSSLKDTTTRSAAVPGTVLATPTYCNITASGSNCTIKVDGTTRASGWSGIAKNGAQIVYTASTDVYAFDSSGTSTKTVTINGPSTYSNSPSHGWYDVTPSKCTSNVSSGWYAVTSSKTTTFTANDGWSFAGSTVKDTTTKSAAVPGSVSATPTYCKITVSTTNCSAKVGGTTRASGWSGIVSNGATIDYTSSTNYAFTAAGKTTLSSTVSGPNTYSASPTYAYYTLSLTNCTYQSGDNSGWYSTSSKPSTVVQANSGWSFGGSSQDTQTIGGSNAVPTTASASPTYFYLTFTPTNCTCSASSKYYTSSTKPSSVTWTPNTYYSFAEGTTQTNSTTSSIASSPTTYTASPSYVRAKSIATGTYNASINRDANTYYAANTVVTWTAIANHYYDARGTTTSTKNSTKITAGAAITAPTPTHVKCTISGTSCTADKTSAIIYPVGELITWTASSGTNYKYSFSNTSISTSATATVALGTTSYSKTASYTYYNVTISPSGGYEADKASGYYLSGTTVTFTAPAETTTKRYSFSTSSSTQYTQSKSVSSAGQTLTNDTAYVWMNCTFSGTNLASKPNDGWHRVSTKPSFTASTATNTKYSFTNTSASSPTVSTTVTIVDGTTSYTKNASYVYYNVTINTTTNANTHSASYSSGYILKDTLVTFTASPGSDSLRYSYSNSDSTRNTTTIAVSSAGQTLTSPVVYTWYNIIVSSKNCTANVASGWRLKDTTITWTANTNYSFVGGATAQTTQSKTVTEGTLSYNNEPYYVKPASVSLTRCTCTVNDATKYYDNRQSYLVSANTNCAFNSSGTATTQSLTLTAGAAVSYSADYVNVTSLSGTNCTTTFTTGWTTVTTRIPWTASTAYAFDSYNTTSTTTSAVPGANTAAANYVKRYTYTLTKNSNVNSIKVWRTSSPYQGAATSTSSSPLINGTGTATIYYGDVISGQAIAATNYHFANGGTLLNLLSTTVTDNLSWSPTVSIDTYPVTITAGKAIESVYLSSSSTATSGSASGTSFNYNSTVYGFAKINRLYISGITIPTTWVSVGSDGDTPIYRVGSGTVTTSGYNFGTVAPTLGSFKVTISAGIGVNSVFLSTDPNATSGSASNTSFEVGSTVYGFAALGAVSTYEPQSTWVHVGTTGDPNNIASAQRIYRVGSVTRYNTLTYAFGSISAVTATMLTVTCTSNLIGLSSVYLSKTSTATSGSSALAVTKNTKVYSFAVLGADVYNVPSSWTLISGTAKQQGAIYRVSSPTITASVVLPINLVDGTVDDNIDKVFFTRTGPGNGTWTIYDDNAQSLEHYGAFTKSGNTIYVDGYDYDGDSHKYTLAEFNCPSGYTATITITNNAGSEVVWGSKHYFNGPYTIEAETFQIPQGS